MNYYRLNDDNFNVKDIPQVPGIYKIIALDNKGIPIPFNRFLGTDSKGILYIGKAENLQKRLSNMKRAFSSSHKSNPHIAVRRYKLLDTPEAQLSIRFPVNQLVIEVEVVNEISAILKEKEVFKMYESLYGERPPLNRQ